MSGLRPASASGGSEFKGIDSQIRSALQQPDDADIKIGVGRVWFGLQQALKQIARFLVIAINIGPHTSGI